MFVDASAIVAILTSEVERTHFENLLQQADQTFVSAIGIYEATLAIARKFDCPPEAAQMSIERFVEETEAQVLPIDHRAGSEAIAAFIRFGKGRHKAALNMGDCFSYALARLHNVPLLCKGDDFQHTDIQIA